MEGAGRVTMRAEMMLEWPQQPNSSSWLKKKKKKKNSLGQ